MAALIGTLPFIGALDVAKAKSYFGHRAREAALLPRVLAPTGNAPRVVFFPCSTQEGASLLRAWAIADALRPLGWATVTIPSQLEAVQRRRLLAAFRPDLVVFQTCRHALNDAAHSNGFRFVLDLDDADFFDPAMADRLNRTCAEAAGVIAGSRFIRDWARALNPNTAVVWTGTPVTQGPRPPHAERAPIIAWAQASPLGYPAELAFIAALDARLRAAGARYRLRLYGLPTEAEREAVRAQFALDADLELMPLLDYEAFLLSLREVAIGLSPIIAASEFSRGKSFGKILGYLDAAVPVIASDEADHALFFTVESGVISNDPAVWEAAILRLLPDPAAREKMAAAATAAMQARLTTKAAAGQVDSFLRRLL